VRTSRSAVMDHAIAVSVTDVVAHMHTHHARAPRTRTTHAHHARAPRTRTQLAPRSSSAHLLHKPQRARRAAQVELPRAHPVLHPQRVGGRNPHARAQVIVSIPTLPRLRNRSGCVASRGRTRLGTTVPRAAWPLLGPTARPTQQPSRVPCRRGSRGRAGSARGRRGR
jgi:hypothetical protein